VVSHDRYFVERVTDDVYGLMGDGHLRHLPRGIDQYIEELHADAPADDEGAWARPTKRRQTPGARVKAERKEIRQIEKEVRRVERELERCGLRESELHEQMVAAASDFARLAPLQTDLAELVAEKERLEAEWLELTERLEART
jgi:ATP-binding cassette subfamily F protein uup